jgi:hypothetical protein
MFNVLTYKKEAKMTLDDLMTLIKSRPESLPAYIRLQEESESDLESIIISADLKTSDGTIVYGAYYGYIGGGMFDGGSFRNDIENSELVNISYDELGELIEAEAAVLEALMGRLWTLIDDEADETPVLTEDGVEFSKQNGGFTEDVMIANGFDGDDLADIEWELRLFFER